jgi:hypothetical protein
MARGSCRLHLSILNSQFSILNSNRPELFELVPVPPHRLEVLRVVGVALDLLAEAADVDGDDLVRLG